VFPPHADPDGPCLLASLLVAEPWRRALPWPDGFAGGVAHRLDISTSGAVAVADSLDELAELRAWFAGKQLRKTYRLLAAREVPWDDNRCDLPIAHDRRRKSRMVVKRGRSTPHRGRWLEAHTELRRLSGRLWEARMHTGVMHQIRVHCAFLGLPLLGDRRYGGGPTPPTAPAGVTFFLHHVGFTGPGGARTAEVPLPAWATPEGAATV
jgi:23S rRNA-/tRNA-specific pseudouridylate synthase